MPQPGWCASLRLELLPHEKRGKKITRNGNAAGNILFSASVKTAKDNKETKLVFAFADADQKVDRHCGGEAVLGILGGWKPAASNLQARRTATWLLDKPLLIAPGDTLTVALKCDNPGSLKISLSPFAFARPLDSPGAELKAALSSPLEQLEAAKKNDLLTRAYLKRHYHVAPGKLNEAVEQKRIEKIRRARPTKFSAARRK